jgi:excinuclease ABC subunit A
VQGRKGEFRDLFESVRKQGFIRAYVDGTLVEVADPPKLNRRQNHSISVVVDRLVVRTDDRGRLADSVETALKLADGLVEVFDAESGTTETFSEKYGCPVCGISMPELEPRQFSFNSPFGACPTCGGLGTRRRVSEELVLGDPRISILEGVVLPWGEPSGYLRKVVLPTLARQFKFDLNMPWGDLPASVRD